MSIVRRNEDRVSVNKQMFDGAGEAKMRQILNSPEELSGKGRLFNHVLLEPGSEIGWHVHHGDSEIYYVLSGEGEYSDNGELVTIRPGDVTVVFDGEGHSARALGPEPLEMIALILYS